MKAVLFDLDDTLYPEMTFVKSGFRAVARYLGRKYGSDEESAFERMVAILEMDGRGKVFDHVLEEMGLHTRRRVGVLLRVYRTHRPDIHLYPDVLPTLRRLERLGVSIGIITGGLAYVQRHKVEALGLGRVAAPIVYTDELGPQCAKPSPEPYRRALELMAVPSCEAAYVGDDPTKDFQGASSLGMITIQVARAGQPPRCGKPAHPAQVVIPGLADIIPIVKEMCGHAC